MRRNIDRRLGGRKRSGGKKGAGTYIAVLISFASRWYMPRQNCELYSNSATNVPTTTCCYRSAREPLRRGLVPGRLISSGGNLPPFGLTATAQKTILNPINGPVPFIPRRHFRQHRWTPQSRDQSPGARTPYLAPFGRSNNRLMKSITLKQILDTIQKYVDGRCDFGFVRKFVNSRYTSEHYIDVEDEADNLLSVIAPYIDTEFAFRDEYRDIRLRRLLEFCSTLRKLPIAAVAVFAMNFDEIKQLTAKRDSGVISYEVYVEQLRKLSPADYDVFLLEKWIESHSGDTSPTPSKLAQQDA